MKHENREILENILEIFSTIGFIVCVVISIILIGFVVYTIAT